MGIFKIKTDSEIFLDIIFDEDMIVCWRVGTGLYSMSLLMDSIILALDLSMLSRNLK